MDLEIKQDGQAFIKSYWAQAQEAEDGEMGRLRCTRSRSWHVLLQVVMSQLIHVGI